jgi:hypothetical protein
VGLPKRKFHGVTMLTGDLRQKRLQLLHDLLPDAKLVGLLQNPGQTPASILPRSVPSSNWHETPRDLGGTLERQPAPRKPPSLSHWWGSSMVAFAITHHVKISNYKIVRSSAR